jgi:thiol-disulfide isomerase/thioredoxin
MTRFAVTVSAVVACASTISVFFGAASAADVPSDRVIAIYFHRTERCPTCLKMGAYSEEAVKTGFADRVRAGTVGFHYVDFQDPRNAGLAKGYGITGPALVVARIANNKVVKFTDLTDIWTKAGDKPAFVKYVRAGISAFDAPPDRVVAMYFHRTQRCPTCRKMGSYAEESVKAKFAKELQEGTIAFYYVDFQKPKNAALVKRYGVSGPALIVANVKSKKVAQFENLGDIWSKVADKDVFMKYVQNNIEQLRDKSAAIARK